MIAVFEQVLLLLIFVAIGFTLTRAKVLNGNYSQIVSGLVVYVFLPCNILNTMGRKFTVKYVSENYKTMLVSVGVLLCVMLLAHLVCKLISKDKYERYVCEYSLIISNSGYMGYALANAIFGTDLNLMVFGLPFSLYIYTIGFSKLTKRTLSFKELLNPIILTTLVGIIIGLSGFELPSFLINIFEKGSSCMAPCCMLLTGIVIAGFKIKDILLNVKVYIVATLRLVGVPLLVGSVLMLLFSKDIAEPAIVYTALPCGLNTVVFARLVGENSRTAAGLALVSTVLSCITIPLVFTLFGVNIAI